MRFTMFLRGLMFKHVTMTCLPLEETKTVVPSDARTHATFAILLFVQIARFSLSGPGLVGFFVFSVS